MALKEIEKQYPFLIQIIMTKDMIINTKTYASNKIENAYHFLQKEYNNTHCNTSYINTKKDINELLEKNNSIIVFESPNHKGTISKNYDIVKVMNYNIDCDKDIRKSIVLKYYTIVNQPKNIIEIKNAVFGKFIYNEEQQKYIDYDDFEEYIGKTIFNQMIGHFFDRNLIPQIKNEREFKIKLVSTKTNFIVGNDQFQFDKQFEDYCFNELQVFIHT